MKTLKITALFLMIIGIAFSLSFAAGDEAKGKVLFNDPKFAGGKRSCSSCHPNGKDLEDVADKLARKELLSPPGTKLKILEETVNFCIVNGNQGKAIDPKSNQMKDMVAYIMSLKPKAPSEAPKKAPAPGY
jgi:cytochrome c